MSTLSKIAILNSEDTHYTFELDEVQQAFNDAGIETRIFEESESILSYAPDCVIVTSAQNAKLTPYPTYGLINQPRGDYLELPRFLRNILTFDGYFTFSPRLEIMLKDIMFGIRKLGTSIEKFDFYPASMEFTAPSIDNNSSIIIFEPDFVNSKFKPAIDALLNNISNSFLLTYNLPASHANSNKIINVNNPAEITKIVHKHGIAVCLNGADNQEHLISTTLMKLIASQAVVITSHSAILQSYFGDNLYYIPNDTELNSLHKVIHNYIDDIKSNSLIAIEKCKKAHDIYQINFSFNVLLSKLKSFHATALINKGYVPNPDPNIEKSLPSVSYIMRTGGKHRHFLERSLNCLVSQKYPDLRVILCIHADFDYLNEILEKYKTLKIKVVRNIKSMRSEAICDGMSAVETDLFGLFDDDDELFPNHVRMLVKTLEYHNNRDWRGEIGMVYSASIHADDTHPVQERSEYVDHKLIRKNEKRAIEHYRLYSSTLMSRHEWFMPNGWLARKSLIDDELLTDPRINTCEDLYFELQIAQKRHYAFSAEVTAVHNFHHFGNSTIEDWHLHIPDTQRIALRNLSRVFPMDSLYDTHYSIVGRPSCYDPNQYHYQVHAPVTRQTRYYVNHPFYPFRKNSGETLTLTAQKYRLRLLQLIKLPFKLVYFTYKFATLEHSYKQLYINKLRKHIAVYGFAATIKKFVSVVSGRSTVLENLKVPASLKKNHSISLYYYKARILLKYSKWQDIVKLLRK